jgi:hypothetical protein
MKFKLLGFEVELTADQAKGALAEILQVIVETMKALDEEEGNLFREIDRAEGRRTVLEIAPDFVRGKEWHDRFRKLRDFTLIRPLEGGQWQDHKHPVVTGFGRLVKELYSKARREAGTGNSSSKGSVPR